MNPVPVPAAGDKINLPCVAPGAMESVRACAVECDVWNGDLTFRARPSGNQLCAAEISSPELGEGVEAFWCEVACEARPPVPLPLADSSLAFELTVAGGLFVLAAGFLVIYGTWLARRRS